MNDLELLVLIDFIRLLSKEVGNDSSELSHHLLVELRR